MHSKAINVANCFDALLVVVDIVAIFLQSVFGDIASLSFLRFLRMLRILRVIHHAAIFRELYLMLMGILCALRAIAFGTVLIVLALLLWSMLAVELLLL